jgi:protein SCO1
MSVAFSQRALRRSVALCLGIVVLLALAACSSGSSAKSITLHGALISPPPPKPNVTLTDTSGQPYDLAQQTQGFLTFVYFGYTHCPDVCPAQMARFGTAVKSLPADLQKNIKVVFVTTDPDRDTPPVIRQWLDHFSTSFVGLTGSQQQIDQAEAAAGIPTASKEDDGAGGYGVNHAAFVLAYTKDNRAHIVYPDGVPLDGLKSDLTQLVKKDVNAVPQQSAAAQAPTQSATP